MSVNKVVGYDERAVDTINAMHAKVQHIGQHFGETSKEYATAAASLARVLAGLTTGGFAAEAKVFRDGDLSLYVIEGDFHYGVIWFRDRDYDDAEAYLTWQPGSWSVHS